MRIRLRFRFFRLFLLSFFLVVLFWSIYPLKERLDQQREIKNLNAKLVRLKKENRVLKDDLGKLKRDEYIELLARKEFGLIKPGEEAYLVATSKEEEVEVVEEKPKKEKPTFWQRVKQFFQRLTP